MYLILDQNDEGSDSRIKFTKNKTHQIKLTKKYVEFTIEKKWQIYRLMYLKTYVH